MIKISIRYGIDLKIVYIKFFNFFIADIVFKGLKTLRVLKADKFILES